MPPAFAAGTLQADVAAPASDIRRGLWISAFAFWSGIPIAVVAAIPGVDVVR